MTNLHIINSPNIGDIEAAPCKYFDLACSSKDIYDNSFDKDQPLIIGGGGLMFPDFDNHFTRITNKHNKPVIIWGVGTNTHDKYTLEISSWVKKGTLIGVRDWGSAFQWVPCASCMSNIWQQNSKPTNRLVAYLHGHYRIPSWLPKDTPVMFNMHTNLQQVAEFLSTGEFVFTNSYHGIYWATLLGKKVLTKAFSSRHCFFKHPPVYLDYEIQEEHFDLAKSYESSLEECRDANIQFFNQVKAIV